MHKSFPFKQLNQYCFVDGIENIVHLVSEPKVLIHFEFKMKSKSILLSVFIVVFLKHSTPVSLLRNEYIGSCSYYENYPANLGLDILTLVCYDSVRKNSIFTGQRTILECSNKHKTNGYQAGTILFQSCQMSRIKYNISREFIRYHTLNISSIELQYLPNDFFTGAKYLKTLIASNNRLLEIPSLQFSHCSQLTDVDYSYNKIHHIEEDAFGGVNTINKLNLSHNHIIELPSKTFANLSQLEIVDISYNNIENLVPYIFANLSKLNRLDLSFNKIKYFKNDVISSQPNLQFLQLSHNNLTIIEMATFAKHKNLHFLDLSYNSIKKIGFNTTRMEHLEILHINENKLCDLNGFKNLLFPSLISFAITGNKFSCSYLTKFLNSFEYHSSLSILHTSTSSPDNSEVHGVNCYQYPSTVPETSPIVPETSTISIGILSSKENIDTAISEFTKKAENALAIPDTQFSYDTTTAHKTRYEQNTLSSTAQSTQTLGDESTSHTIKHLLIVLCVLVALNVGIVIIKIIRNRKTTSILPYSATNYSCAYNRDIGQIIPSVAENQYETISIGNKGSRDSDLLN